MLQLTPQRGVPASRESAPGRTRDAEDSRFAPAAPEGACAQLADGCNGTQSQRAGAPGRQWLLWQLADSAFPAGGFAHSGGLETAFQQGELSSSSDLRSFIEASLRQAGRASLPFMLATFDAPERLAEIDRLCDGFMTNHVANRASRLQGQALLASAESIFGTLGLKSLRDSGIIAVPHGHLAPVFGALLRELQLERADGCRLLTFWHLRGLVSAGVRLGLVGPLEGQAMQYSLASLAAHIVLHCQALTIDDVAQTAPLLELWQVNHDRLYSRLFQS